jgi:hypothetical protein
MKTLSARFTFVILTGIALLTVLSCSEKKLATEENFKFRLKIGKDPGPGEPVFADANKEALDKALDALKSPEHGGKCYVAYQDPINGHVTVPYRSCTDFDIVTNKVTTSAKAKNEPAGASTANDPNITYRVYSSNINDMRAVLASLIPTPTPSN